jgi:hypothetical protein
MSDFLRTLYGILAIVIGWAAFFVLLALTMRICIHDAHRRGKSPALVCIACILFFPWGTLAWLVFRPDPKNRPGSPSRFRLEDHRLQ